MNKRTFHRLFSVLMALVMAVSLLTGCGTKTAENVEKQKNKGLSPKVDPNSMRTLRRMQTRKSK